MLAHHCKYDEKHALHFTCFTCANPFEIVLHGFGS